MQMQNKRYVFLDTLRGLAVGNMIVYHAVWDLVYLFGISLPWYQSQGAYIWQQAICWVFLFLSGFCQRLGRHRIRRGLVIFFAGMLISVVTMIALPEGYVLFGVLTLIGSGALLTALLDSWFMRCPPGMGLAVSLALFVVTKAVPQGYLGLLDWQLLRLPAGWYCNLATAFLGFPPDTFVSSDYVPLIPWLFLFMAGYFLYGVMVKHGWLEGLKSGNIRPLAWIGRHSLGIYLLHQPVLYAVLSVFL